MEVLEKVLEDIQSIANKAIMKDGHFLFGVTGGTSTRSIYQNLAKIASDFSKWKVVLLDERWVKVDHEDSNQNQIISSFLVLPGFKKDSFFGFHHESSQYPDKEKTDQLLQKIGHCHLSLLGVGEDGHICGLFPQGLKVDKENNSLTIITENSPKPPSPRISVSYSYLQKSDKIFFLVFGPSKAHLLKKEVLDSQIYPFSYLKKSSKNSLFTDQTA